MVRQAQTVKFEALASELEALLIEAELIRLHQPHFNTLLKDDKTPLYIHLTNHTYPQVLTVRKKDVDHQQLAGTVLGPFPSAYKAKEVLKIARQIFPWCNQAQDQTPDQLKHSRACFYYHLEQCPGACVDKTSPADYQHQISQLKLFLQGKKEVLKNLQIQLKKLSNQEKFEQAATTRDRIQLIKAVTNQRYPLKPDLVLPNLINNRRQEALLHLRKILTTYSSLPKNFPLERIEGYDVSNTAGQLAAVSMVVFINGQPAKKQYRLFNIKTLDTPNDYQMLKEAIIRRQNHPEWGRPDLLLIDGGKNQLRAALHAWQGRTLIISIAKNPDWIMVPVQISRQPRLKVEHQIISLPQYHPTLHLIQHIRNESHRFSKKQHLNRRLKNMLDL